MFVCFAITSNYIKPAEAKKKKIKERIKAQRCLSADPYPLTATAPLCALQVILISFNILRFLKHLFFLFLVVAVAYFDNRSIANKNFDNGWATTLRPRFTARVALSKWTNSTSSKAAVAVTAAVAEVH